MCSEWPFPMLVEVNCLLHTNTDPHVYHHHYDSDDDDDIGSYYQKKQVSSVFTLDIYVCLGGSGASL